MLLGWFCTTEEHLISPSTETYAKSTFIYYLLFFQLEWNDLGREDIILKSFIFIVAKHL